MAKKEIRLKVKQKFIKDNKKYDSSWEYKYEQFLIKNNIKYDYHPDVYFEYEFENKIHLYFPDFAIYDENNKLSEIIEIKSEYLFNKMLIKNTLENQKYKCILENNVKILLGKDLKDLGII